MRVLPQRILDPYLDLASVPPAPAAAAGSSCAVAVPAATPEQRVTARSSHETKHITRSFARRNRFHIPKAPNAEQ